MDGSRLQNTPAVILLRLLGDLLLLNLLTIICSLPVVTAGASLSAMYAVLFDRRHNDGSVPVVKTFFHAFGQNFLQATVLELILAVLAVLAFGDFWFAGNVQPPLRIVYQVIGTVIVILALTVFLLAFTQQSIFRNTVKNYLKNTVLLAFCAPGRLVLAMAVWIAPWYLMVILPEVFLLKFGYLYLLWGFSFPAWMTVWLLDYVFEKAGHHGS